MSRPGPTLEKLFGGDVPENMIRRRAAVLKVVGQDGYRQQEIAVHLMLHYSSVSRIVKGGRWMSNRRT
jgi:hypothetical protein